MIEADVILALRFGGPQTPSVLAGRLDTSLEGTTDALGGLLGLELVQDRPASSDRNSYRLTEKGRAYAESLCGQEQGVLGEVVESIFGAFERSEEALKEALHRWQVRPLGSASIPNDHQDPVWDAAVLRDLARIVQGFRRTGLESLADIRPRYGHYARRLQRALDRAGADDPRWVAGLEVDSVHGIWWELHEDLLCMLGRGRDPGAA